MDDFSRQRINFIEVLPVLYSRIPSVSQTLILWAVVAALLGLQHLMASHSHEQLRLDKESLTGRLNEALEALSGEAVTEKQGKLVAISDDALKLNDIGFYDDLLALAQHYSTQVWFTRIMIDKEKQEVVLEGDASSTQALNDLYSKLIKLPEFADYGLNLRDIKRITRTEKEAYILHSFVITNVKQYRRRSR
jgi:hypothetical protein